MDPRLGEFNDDIEGPDHIRLAEGKLEISFQRTVRVSDDENVSDMPPSFGPFPIYPVSKFKNMPAEIKEKKGYFIPMYLHEALFIQFRASHAFAIKIYVGGVNAISGGLQAESPDEMYARQSTNPQQDYIVLPQQKWLDGIALPGGMTRQFVAVSSASGQVYSVETQVRGTRGDFSALTFEVIPSQGVIPRPLMVASFKVTIKTLTGKNIVVIATSETFVWELKAMIQDQEGIPPDQQRLVARRMLAGGKTGYEMENKVSARLVRYGIEAECQIHLVLLLRGGGYSTPNKRPRYVLPNYEMSLGVGGRIRQRVADIVTDPYDPDSWDIDRITFFNINILDSRLFRPITNHAAPVSPIDAAAKLPVNAADYAKLNLEYFKEAEDVFEVAARTEEAEQDREKWEGLKSLCEMEVLSEPSQNSSSVLVDGVRNFESSALMLARAFAMKALSDEDAKRPDSDFKGKEKSERENYNNMFRVNEDGTGRKRKGRILSWFKDRLSRVFITSSTNTDH